MGMNLGALVGQLAGARADVKLAFRGVGDLQAAIEHHDVLNTEVARRLGVVGAYLASVPGGVPTEVAAAWNGGPA